MKVIKLIIMIIIWLWVYDHDLWSSHWVWFQYDWSTVPVRSNNAWSAPLFQSSVSIPPLLTLFCIPEYSIWAVGSFIKSDCNHCCWSPVEFSPIWPEWCNRNGDTLNPNGNWELDELIKLVNEQISGNMADDKWSGTTGSGGSKLGLGLGFWICSKLSNGGAESVPVPVPDAAAVAVAVVVTFVSVVTVVVAAVVLPVRLELSLLEFCEFDDFRTPEAWWRWLLLDLDFERFVFRQPPPTGTLRRTPPLVQYLRQLLQKWRGWDKL